MISEQALLLTYIIMIIWLVLVVGFAIYFSKKIMPDLRKLRETPAGQKELAKILFPPRFFRD